MLKYIFSPLFLRKEISVEKYCITIAREYGSGGRLIGKQIAAELGIAFYDKEIISMAADKTGLHEDFIEDVELHRPPSFFLNTLMATPEIAMPDRIFITQSNIIKELAAQSSCVIVGRCADYVLRENAGCAHVFVHAPLPYRVRFARDHYGETRSDLDAFVKRKDKARKSYYNHFTQMAWGHSQNYHLCIDSSIGVDTSVKIIECFIRKFTLTGDPQ
jgi:cytidylate kinase